MHILLVSDSPEAGGAETALAELATDLRQRGHGATVWMWEEGAMDELARELRAEGLTVRRRSHRRLDPVRLLNPWELAGAVRTLRDIDPDIVHFSASWPTQHAMSYLACVLTGTPFVVRFQVLPDRPLFDPAGRLAPMLRGELSFLLRRAGARIALTHHMRDSLSRSLRLSGTPWEVVPNGRDLAAYASPAPDRAAELRRQWNPTGRPLIVSVGRLVEQKDPSMLIGAAERVRESHPAALFLWAGTGPLRDEAEALIARKGLGETVRLMGHVDDVPELLSLADLFALPSRFEGLPLSGIEAMAAGLPVVAPDVTGFRDLVEDGDTGRLVEPGSLPAFADGIRELLEAPAARRRMGKAARSHVMGRYDRALVADAMERIYRTVLTGAD